MTTTLLEDLSLVLANPAQAASLEMYAAEDVKDAAAAIHAASAPAITGVENLTMQAVRAAVQLARAMRGRLLPNAGHGFTVQQGASLGHVMNCDFVIQPGPAQWAAEHPVAIAIANRVLHQLFVPPDLDSLLQLRAEVRDKGASAITDITQREVRRLAVVLPPHCAVEAISQWHKLAADLQTYIRTCVLHLPDLATSANTRGAAEVVTWMTGITGAVDFSTGQAQRCHAVTGCDCQIDIEPGGVIRIGDKASFHTPGLSIGLNAHVMRFDGIVLRLCDDPAASPPDPAVELLELIAEAL